MIAISIYCVKIFIDAYKWYGLNSVYNINIPFSQILRYKIIAPAFDLIAPLPQGENIYKFYVLKKVSSVGTAVSIPVLINISGLFAILIFLPFTIKHYLHSINTDIHYTSFPPKFGLTVAIIAFYILWKNYGKLFSGPNMLMARFAEQLKVSVITIRSKPLAFFRLFLLSLAAHICYVTFVWTLVCAIGITLSFKIILFSLPLIYTAAVVPFINRGVGLKEGVILWLLTLNGVGIVQSEAVALCHLCVVLFFLVIGLVFLVADRQ